MTDVLGLLDPHLDLSIIIVNWNTRDLLCSCLSSIEAHQNGCCLETIVVDNGSQDGSADMLQQKFPWVRVIRNQANRGFAAATNQGLSHARGRYILLLNSDTILLPGALEAMVRYMDGHPAAGALGPRLLHADGSLQTSIRRFARPDADALTILDAVRFPLIGPFVHRYLDRITPRSGDHNYTHTVDWVTGACLLLRREALEQVGTLDEGYFFFAEEMDLCYRLHHYTWTVAFLADACIIHLGGQSAQRIPAARLFWHYRGLLRFYQLHRPRYQQIILRIVIALTAGAHIIWIATKYHGDRSRRPILSSYARVLACAVQYDDGQPLPPRPMKG